MPAPEEGRLGPDETLNVDQFATFTTKAMVGALSALDDVADILGHAEAPRLRDSAHTVRAAHAATKSVLAGIIDAWTSA